jgi:hypothetical protein
LSKAVEPVNTRAEIAKVANVSEGTIAKVKTIKANNAINLHYFLSLFLSNMVQNGTFSCIFLQS